MLFSSLLFIFAFLPIVLLWGGVSYTVIIIISVLVNYLLGLFLNKPYKFLILCLGLILNLGTLFYFKYLAFLISIVSEWFSFVETDSEITKIMLPVGISFYTFQAISYLIDVYYGKVSIQKRLDHLAVYIVLFPQLIAGPIIRYHEIKDQIASRKDSLMNFSEGLTRFAYGLGKKVLIANVLGEYALEAFSGPYQDLDIITAWTGTILYAFQIYFDFSGYSDMAIGLGKMFGFDFPENFNFPYAANSIKDFWRRWHITLSNWFRDYLYIPLGGNRKGSYRTLLNLLIVFIVTGFWHGAAWCFLYTLGL